MTDTSDIRFLTGHDVEFGDHGAVHIAGARPRALFVALALNANTDVSRDWLADLLWTDVSQSQARQRLRMALLNLRKCLEEVEGVTVAATPDTLRLELDDARLDFRRFETGLTEGLETYRGDLLARFPSISEEFDRFLAARRNSLRSLFLTSALDRLRGLRRAGDEMGFQKGFNAIVAIDPANESAAELAMQFWASAGRGDLVTQVFERYRDSLFELVGEDPPDAMAAAYEALLESARSTVPVEREGKAPAPVSGEAGLRRGRWPMLRIAVAAAASGVVAFWLGTQFLSGPDGPVFIVLPPEATLADCKLDDPADDYRAALLEALNTIEDATTVIGKLRGAFAGSGDEAYLVRQRVDCAGEKFRGTTIITDKEAGTVMMSSRHSEVPGDAAEFGAEIEELIPSD